jgi:hypothetical protein
MRTSPKLAGRAALVSVAVLVLAPRAHAWEPNAGDLATAINTGDFAGYFANVSAWLNRKTPGASDGMSEAAMTRLLRDPAFLNALAQRQFLVKHGVEKVGVFSKAGPANRRFLAWLLRDTEAMDLYLIGATPTGLKKREADSYTLPVASLDLWNRILTADPDSRKGLYLKLAIATALSPPPKMSYVGAHGIGSVPIDPVQRYKHYKTAHKNGELFPIFDTLTVWELRKVVPDWAADRGLGWVRQMLNTWRPDLRSNQQVHRIVSEVWRRNSPIPFSKGFITVMEGGGKCGPRSWFGRMTCRAFGIPAVGVGQPGHAAFAIKAADPASQPQPGAVWKVVYGRAWHVSKAEGLPGPEFVAEAEARAREPGFSQGEHLRWLAAALTSKKQAEAVRKVVRKVQPPVGVRDDGVVAAPGADRTSPLPVTRPVPEAPVKVAPGVLHVEAETFSGMSGVHVYDCFTGGKQVNFQKNIKSSWIDYRIDVPAAGVYGLTMRIATPNREQVLNLSSGTDKLATIQIPNTTGLWGTTKEVSVRLKKGVQTLRFSAPYQRGIAVRWFELKSK